MNAQAIGAGARPGNVPMERAVDFDIYNPMTEGQDPHTAWKG
jgi:hypothetical protein